MFSSRTEITPGKDIILACDSREINKYISTTSVVGFTGPVDATVGGLIVSFLLAPQDSVLKTTYEHIVEIARGMVGPEFLDLSLAEITYWTAIFFLSILAYYSSNPLVVENPTWVQLVVHFLSENAITNSPSIVLTLVYLLLGQIDVWVAVWQIIAFVITDVPAAFGQMLTDSEVMNDQLFVATIVLALAMVGLGLFYGRLSFDLALLLAGIVFIFGGVVIDFNDDNDWVG
ncbi:MAG: hypothetical protein DRO73_09935 [Candidatus Thorarchaeota archaeon]|nr:MAG: hypothetical protein DRO73_09935 [Candidatus Thorarchaeota archaeon]